MDAVDDGLPVWSKVVTEQSNTPSLSAYLST